MSPEKTKQLAPVVVLARQGNKDACRTLYKEYFRNIYFICKCMTGDSSEAQELTAEVFAKMFECLDKLEDHAVFEQWFYSLAISVSRRKIKKSYDIVDGRTIHLAHEARDAVAQGDKKSFEKRLMQIAQRMIFCFPEEARVVFLYSSFAELDAQKIALLEKIDTQEAEKRLRAIDVFLENQAERIKKYDIDMSVFVKDKERTIKHIVEKTEIPSSLHNAVSEKTGFGVFTVQAPEEKKETQALPVENQSEKRKKNGKKTEKEEKSKWVFTKGDFILFIAVVAVVFVVFSVVGNYFESKEQAQLTTAQSQGTGEKPALLWNGASAAAFDGGEGTAENPYRIATGGQLAYLSNLVNDGNSYYAACNYILVADIILNETDDYAQWEQKPPENRWTPIGCDAADDSHSYFTGSFDGNGHAIKGMYISHQNEYAGLFGVVRNASIKNLAIYESYVCANGYVGGIAGYFSSDSTTGSGFEGCSFSGKVISQGNNAGGITGYFRSEGEESFAEISSCCVSGSVVSSAGYCGAIAGACESANGLARIKNCFSSCTVTADGSNAGGITGDCRVSDGVAAIEMCYNSGKISAGENAGGISGASGCTEGKGRVSVHNSFMLSSCAPVLLTKTSDSERLVMTDVASLDADGMLSEENFVGFDFENIWQYDTQGTYKYPVLRNIPHFYVENVREEESTY